MTKYKRALDGSEINFFVNNSKGVNGKTLCRIFGNNSALYARLNNLVDSNFIQKEQYFKENIYYSKDFDLGKVAELDEISKVVIKLDSMGFKFKEFKLSNENNQELFINTFYEDYVDKIGKEDSAEEIKKTLTYKFRVTRLTFENIEEYQTVNTDYLDIVVINDFELIQKIALKLKANTLGQTNATGIRRDVVVYDITTNNFYVFNFKDKINLNILKNMNDFYVMNNEKNKKAREIKQDLELAYYRKLYDLKVKNVKKYSKNREGV
ncbi:hypothetical protein [Enterococcus italicus]|nr:hypothetical protein [Enterococcus italicus]OJG58020.1 hypothetical protein RT43_GL000938 [Enterococcus italicus DSM 15952]